MSYFDLHTFALNKFQAVMLPSLANVKHVDMYVGLGSDDDILSYIYVPLAMPTTFVATRYKNCPKPSRGSILIRIRIIISVLTILQLGTCLFSFLPKDQVLFVGHREMDPWNADMATSGGTKFSPHKAQTVLERVAG